MKASAGVLFSVALLLCVTSLSASASVGVNKSFNPISASVGQKSTLTIDLLNANASDATGTTLTDNLPTGLVIATPPNAGTTCGGTLTATAAGSSVSLSGGTIPAATTTPGGCQVTVDVVAATPSSYVNTIPAGNVSSSLGSNSQDASATFTVVALAPIAGSKAFSPTNVHGGGTTRLTITLPNSNGVDLTGVHLTDTLPAQLVVAGTPNLATTCTPGTPSSTATTVSISGATIPAGGSCTFSVDVTPTTPNTFLNSTTVTNTVAANLATSDQGVSNNAFSKAVTVQTSAQVTKAFSPTSITSGGTSTLTVKIANFNATAMSPLDFTDTLPAGMTTAGTATTTCTGATPNTAAGSFGITGGSLAAAPAGSGSTSCTITVSVTAANAGTSAATLTNTIDPGAFGTQTYPTSNAKLTVNPASSITGSKTYSGSLVQTGLMTVTINLTNTTASAANITSFTDDLTTMGAGFTIAASPAATTTCAGGSPTAVPGDTLVTMASGTIGAGASCTITVPVQIGPTVTTTNLGHTNTIAAGAVVTSQGSNVLPISQAFTVGPALTVAKSFSPSTVFAGTDSMLTITVTRNANVSALTGLALTDPLPAGHVVGASPAAATTCTGATVVASPGSTSISLSGGSLAGGAASTSCTITVPVTTPNTGGSATNTIAVGNVTTTEGVKNVSAATAVLTRTTNFVSLSKGFNLPVVALGGTSQMSLQILNNNAGAVALTGGTLTDNLPVGMNVAATPNAGAQPSCGAPTITAVAGASTVTVSNASIAAGSVCVITVDVVANAAGNLTNTLPIGSFTSAQGTNNIAPVSATLTSAGTADLSVTKTDNVATATAGGIVTYTVTYSNAGPDDVAGAPITDNPPPGMTFTGWTCVASSNAACTAASGSGPLTGGVTIPAAGSVTYTVTAQIDPSATGTIANTASISAPGSVVDNNTNNNSTTDTDTLIEQVDLAITKAGPATIIAGQTMTYTVTVTNLGPSTSTAATITDNVPAAITNVQWTCAASGTSSCGTTSGTGNAVVLNPTAIVPGDALTITITGTAPSGQSVTNTATVSDPNDTNTNNNSDSTTAGASTPVRLQSFEID